MENKTEVSEVTTSRKVSILGTGNFAVALAKRLLRSGYDVCMGSRRPGERAWLLEVEGLASLQLCTIGEAISRNDVIMVALHVEHFQETLEPHRDSLSGKLLIDVTNRTKKSDACSNTEKLLQSFPLCRAVKAFNVISAYSLENDCGGESRQVLVAGSDAMSREYVMRMSRDLGLVPVELGGLQSARKIEEQARELFPYWRLPLIVAAVLTVLVTLYLVLRIYAFYVYWRMDQLFLLMMNKTFAVVSLQLLALAYVPGGLAAILQLWRGSKHRPFPKWLDWWMRCRKQFGQLSVAFVIAHACASFLLLSPSYFYSWYIFPPVTNATESQTNHPKLILMNWQGESSMLLGVLALVLLLVLAVSSLPGVSATLHWREWRLLHSRVGHLTLALAAAHVVIIGMPYWLTVPFYTTVWDLLFLSVQIALWTLVVRLVLLLPCLSWPLARIRKGWERGTVRAAQSSPV